MISQTRMEVLQHYIHESLECMDDLDRKGKALGHLYDVSMAAALLAGCRGADAELAAMAGLLHDLYAYQVGSYEDHAHRGAEEAQKILTELGLTTSMEMEQICHAIYCHDDLDVQDDLLDEILKDADVMHNTLCDPECGVSKGNLARYIKLRDELGCDAQKGRQRE